MTELKASLKSIKYKDEPLPQLSLNVKKSHEISEDDQNEQEKLWTRSLEYFHEMNTSAPAKKEA